MSRKAVWIVIICCCAGYFSEAQVPRFILPPGISPSDYEAGVVLVKVKPRHKDVLQHTPSGARLPSAIRAADIKPLLSPGFRTKSVARMAPRKPHVDLSLYYRVT